MLSLFNLVGATIFVCCLWWGKGEGNGGRKELIESKSVADNFFGRKDSYGLSSALLKRFQNFPISLSNVFIRRLFHANNQLVKY